MIRSWDTAQLFISAYRLTNKGYSYPIDLTCGLLDNVFVTVDSKKKILLIEDDQTLCQIYRINFEMAGYELEEAHDGKIGLAYALNHKPDLIILDLMLPGVNGLELLKVIKEKETTKDIPVLVLTNLSGDELEEAKNLGACNCFSKTTVTPKILTDEVKKALDN